MKFGTQIKGAGKIIFWIGFCLSALCTALLFFFAFYVDNSIFSVFTDVWMCVFLGMGILLFGSILFWIIGVVVDALIAKNRK